MFEKFHKIFDAFTNSERQIFQGAAIVFAVSFIINSANIFYKKTILEPVQGGSYVEGLIGQPIALNPLVNTSNDVDKDIIEILFLDLFEITADYKLSQDQKTWELELKKNLNWSDGEPLSSDDVIFTLETIQNSDINTELTATWKNVIAEKIDQSKLRINLKTPYAFFIENMKSLKIVPHHIFGVIPIENIRISDFNLEPVTSGPYAFLNYKKRRDGFINEYNFSINQNYHDKEALIRDIKFRFFTNTDEAIEAFNRGEIDGLGGLSSSSLEKFKIGYQLSAINIPRYYAIFLNQSIRLELKNPEVREALNLATDKERLVKEVLKTRGIAINGPIFPGTEGYDLSIANQNSEFSIEKARELLEKNGWKLNEETKLMEKESASRKMILEFEIIVPEINFITDAVKIIEEDWRKIGIKINPIILNPVQIANDIIKSRNYEMLLFGNILKNTPDVFSFWHSSEKFHPGLNLSLYENKIVDSLLESIRSNFSFSSRIGEIKKFQEIINNDKPAVFLFSPSYLYANSKDLKGFTPELISSPSNRFNEISKWYIKTARIFK